MVTEYGSIRRRRSDRSNPASSPPTDRDDRDERQRRDRTGRTEHDGDADQLVKGRRLRIDGRMLIVGGLLVAAGAALTVTRVCTASHHPLPQRIDRTGQVPPDQA